MAQNSPSPLILDYAGSSLGDTLNPDSTFCKGGILTIHGSYFVRATGGEIWDTTRIFIGGLSGVQAPILSVSTAANGMNDTIVFGLPDLFLADTCLQLALVKSTHQGGFPFTYTHRDTICLKGDFARVSYPDTLFCLGDSNPLPQIILGPGTTGTFCCSSGASGFIVLGTGEIPLYPGAAGLNNQFQYHTNHPQCRKNLNFNIDILPINTSQATYGGLTTLMLCKLQSHNPIGDTANLVPAFGQGHFADPLGGLVLLDSLTGEIDLQNSQPGTHQLFYLPHLPCYDTALINITISAPVISQIIYPGIGPNLLLCQRAPVLIPAFINGPQGGSFWSVPSGIAFGQSGQLIPALSAPGSYAVFYLPPGNCADTTTIYNGLQIDSIIPARLGFSQQSICLGDSLRLDTLSGTITLSLNSNILYAGIPANLALASLGLSGGQTLSLTLASSGNCPDTASALIQVLRPDDATFSYPNPAYCLGDPDPYPLIGGLSGGTFSANSPNTSVSPAGKIDLAASGPGQHTILYVTSGPCPDSATVTVYIYAAASAQFSYAASTFCQGQPNPTPTLAGAPGGTFSAGPGLLIHPATGLIVLDSSAPGTYNVSYTLSGGCMTSFSQTIALRPIDSLSRINYASATYCEQGTDPGPAIFGDAAGTFFGSAGLIFSNRDSGLVDLSATGSGGPFLITLDLDNDCAIDPTATIYILKTDSAAFSYPAHLVCEDEAPLETAVVWAPGGVFTCSSSQVVFADSLGSIDLVGSLPGGPYTIMYQTAGPCPASASQLLTILEKPQGIRLKAFPDGTICAGDQVILQAVAGNAVSNFSFFVNGDPVAGAFDLLQSDRFQSGDWVVCVLENSAGCRDTIGKMLAVAPRGQVQVLDYGRKISRREPARLLLGAYVDGTIYDWKATGLGPIEIYESQGQTSAINQGENLELVINYRMTNNTDPAKIRVMLKPQVGGCPGKADTLEVGVLPSDFSVFVPEFLSPNGDGLNDTWQVHWKPEVNPEDYTLHLYNRSDGEVARIRPLDNRFDGKTLPDGVYWWTLENHRAGNRVQAGGLTIRRQ